MRFQVTAGILALFQSPVSGPVHESHPPVGTVADIPLENVSGRHINFGLAALEPMVLSSDGSVLYAVNQPGARLAMLDPATLARVGQAPLGLGAVSVALRPGSSEVWVVDALESCVDVVDPALQAVVRSIHVGADPRGIVFTPAGDRAYVTCSAVDRVDVISTQTYAVAKSIAIPARNPRGIAYHAGKAYVVSFLSGNGTAPEGSLADPSAVERVGVPGPPAANALPDRDLFVIPTQPTPAQDALDPSATVTGLGTILFDVHVRPGTDELWIPNTDALNAAHKGEVNFVAGQVVRNRITIVDSTGTVPPRVVDLDAIAPADVKCAQPTYVAFDPVRPLVYVAGYGSDLVAVLHLGAGGAVTWQGHVDLPPSRTYPRGTGPRACFVDPARTALYAYDMNDDAVSRIPTTSLPSTNGWSLTAPIAVRVGLDLTSGFERLGRHLFTNARFSASKTSSCASCHVDGHTDGLVWDLSHFLDPEGTPDDQLQFGTDVKGPLVTQSVRSLGEGGPFHWRGEIPSTNGFAPAFVTLLENTVDGVVKPIGPDFQYLRHFMDLLAIPPNPREAPDRRLSGEALAGAQIFRQRPIQGSSTCASCHVPPTGTSDEIAVESDGGAIRSLAVPSLRGVADKLSAPIDLGGPYGLRSELGAGLTHAGTRSSLEGAIVHPAGPGEGHHDFQLSPADAHEIAAYLSVLDTGIAPAAATQVTANSGNWPSVAATDLPFLKDAASRGDCDLVFHRVPRMVSGKWTELSGLYDPVAKNFRVGSRLGAPIGEQDLLQEASHGQPVMFLGVPVGMGEAQGLDRDMDGLFDQDELAAGTDPENPDTDGDSYADGYEVTHSMDPLQPGSVPQDAHPPTLVGPLRLTVATTTTLQFQLETSEFCKLYVGYNGDGVVVRLPFNTFGDHHHWVVLNELQPDTDYRIELTMTDPAGNSSTDQSTVFHTLPRATPDPSHVGALDLSIQSSGGQPALQSRVSIRVADAAAGPGYGVTIAAYQSDASGALHMLANGSLATTQADGSATFLFALPPAAPSPGKLHVVVEDVAAPVGGAAYARGLDTPNYATIAY